MIFRKKIGTCSVIITRNFIFLPGVLGRATGDAIFRVPDEYILENVLLVSLMTGEMRGFVAKVRE
jgi:hypothetical protein